MTKKRSGDRDDPRPESERGVSRRDFVRTGAAAGLGTGALLAPDPAQGQASAPNPDDVVWDYEVDVVVAGAGCAGLTAAIRARDLGASVLVVDQNFDVGGRMLHSGSFVSLGGGDPVQRRDMKGESDKEGLITADPAEAPEELDDSVDLLFTDLTDWSVVDPKAQSPYRYNEREVARAWAENAPATRQFLIANYVRFTRVTGTHGGGGLSAGTRGALLPHGGRQNRHQGGHDHGRGCRGRRSRAHERARAAADERREPLRRSRGREQRRGPRPAAGVLGAREGRRVHAAPPLRRPRS